MAKKIICPECKREVESNVTACPNCGFDIYLYVSEYKRIYGNRRKYHWHCNNCKYEW